MHLNMGGPLTLIVVQRFCLNHKHQELKIEPHFCSQQLKQNNLNTFRINLSTDRAWIYSFERCEVLIFTPIVYIYNLWYRFQSSNMSSDDRRHLMEEKTFAVFTAESINTMAESAGHQPIPHEAAAALGEDVSYRMRQLVMVCT